MAKCCGAAQDGRCNDGSGKSLPSLKQLPILRRRSRCQVTNCKAMSHSMINGNACFACVNKICGTPYVICAAPMRKADLTSPPKTIHWCYRVLRHWNEED